MVDIPKLARIKQDDENMEKLHIAARKGQTDHILRLLETDISPSIQNKFGCSALHLACKYGQVGAVRVLAPISDLSQSWHGQKPLHLAVLSNNEEIVRVLLEGAKGQGKAAFEIFLNECDEFELTEVRGEVLQKHITGQTALHWCVCLGECHMSMMKLLLSFGANPTAKDKNGETPIMRAIELKDEIAFDILVDPSYGNTLRFDICDKKGKSTLQYAITNNLPQIAMKLLKLGHDVTQEDIDKNTAILLAIRAAMPEVLEAVLEIADQFQVLSCNLHNGFAIQPERIEYFPFVDEMTGDGNNNNNNNNNNNKQEVIKVFNRKLEAINLANAPPSTGDEKKKKKKKKSEMITAPSAPVKRRIS
eukprot:Tbor_TRINITY_DN5718_c6_g1::TRINITY_DN5718_c6_g1_i2::g.19554::m.19554